MPLQVVSPGAPFARPPVSAALSPLAQAFQKLPDVRAADFDKQILKSAGPVV